jgi:uncharacterized protein (TIGR03382 family)
MQLRFFVAALFLAFFGSGCLQEGIDRTEKSLGGYVPPAGTGTVCPWPPDGGHGVVNSMCADPTCDPGFANCDSAANMPDHNGCESNLTDPSTCGACANNCHECREQATCNNGVCEGKARPDDSACHAFGCDVVGRCQGGTCMCPDLVDGGLQTPSPLPSFKSDVHQPANDGHSLPGDCSFTGGGTATAAVLLLVGAVALLFRRR